MKAFLRFCVICVLVTAAWQLCGGEFEPSDVTSEAKWILHLDGERIRQSKLGEFALNRDLGPNLSARLQMADALFGFDVRKDLQGLTMFGLIQPAADPATPPAHYVVMVVRGNFDREKFTAELRTRDGFESRTHGAHTLMRIVQQRPAAANGEGKTQTVKRVAWCAFFDDTTFVLAERQEQLTHTLDVLADKAPSLADKNPFAHLGTIRDGAMLMAGANLADMQNVNPQAAIFREAKSISLSVAEKAIDTTAPATPANTRFEALLLIDAKTAKGADQVKRTVDGYLAFALLNPEEQPLLANLAQHVRVIQEGTLVRVSFAYPVNELMALATLFEQQLKHSQPPAATPEPR